MLFDKAIAAWPPSSMPRRPEGFKAGGLARRGRKESAASRYLFDGSTDLEFERVTKLRSGDALYMTALLPRGLRRDRVMPKLASKVRGAGNEWRDIVSQARRTGSENGECPAEGNTDILQGMGGVPDLQLLDLTGNGGAGGLDAFLGLQDGAEEGTAVEVPSCDSPASQPEPRKERPRVKASPRCITAPASMPVARADFDLAQRCLDAGRCFLLMPPPLCALAPVLLVANSYLQDNHVDHRVLILCIGLRKLEVEAVAAYAKSFLAETGTSLEHVHGKHGDGLNQMSGVVVAAGLGCLGPDDLALFSNVTVILSPQPATTVDGNGREQLEKARSLGTAAAGSLTTIFAIYPECVDLPAMAPWFQVAREVFNVTNVVLQNSLTEDESVRSRTDFLSNTFVVLPKAPQEAIGIFEEAAFPLLRSLNSEPGSKIPLTLLSAETADLHRLLQRCRADQTSAAARERMQKLVLLNTQKRALVYCLDECIERGLAFLTEASSRYPNALLAKCVAGLRAIQTRCAGQNTPLIHHRVARVRSLVQAERANMRGECKTAHALRAQKTFRPLIIADSTPAVDHLLRSIPASVEVDKLDSLLAKHASSSCSSTAPQPSFTCVAHRDQLSSSPSAHSAALRYFAQFSHVVHLASISGAAPPPLPAAQLAHAGRLRLVGVHVDVAGDRDARAQAARAGFNQLCLEAGAAGGARGDIAGIQAVLEALHGRGAAAGAAAAAAAKDAGGRKRIDVGIGVLARRDVNWIAGFLFKQLSGAEAALEVRVHVPAGCGTRVAGGRLMQAVCSYRPLLDAVAVSYVMGGGDGDGDGDAAAAFRPRKQVRRTEDT